MISQGPSLCIFNKEDPQEVLASWLFTQYLVTNDVQISYAKTEGYVPVSKKAMESEEYQEYLAKAGSDDNEHYSIKIDASKLLIEHTADSFVTPVFNGSASLRDAAGSLIESTCKAVRRNEVIDDSFIDDLYSDTSSLYHLDQASASKGKRDLGPLPVTSKVLLGVLALTWIFIGAYYLRIYLKQSKS